MFYVHFTVWYFTLMLVTKATSDQQDLSRIIDGDISGHAKWPFMASIMYSRIGHICGGVVWNQDTILTAAHCL